MAPLPKTLATTPATLLKASSDLREHIAVEPRVNATTGYLVKNERRFRVPPALIFSSLHVRLNRAVDW